MNTLKNYLDQKVGFSPELFRGGDKVLAPVMTWAWFRGPEKAEMMRTLDAAKRAGFGTVYILPMPKEFRPGTMPTELEGYLTPAYFDKVREALEYADGIGLSVWLYDEGGWPSGGACGRVLAQRQALRPRRVRKEENGAYHIAEQGGLCSDIYSAEAAEYFTHITHDAYAQELGGLSEKVAAIFTDEPAGYADAAGPDILRTFEETYGYRLEEHFDAIVSPDGGAEHARVRRDYFTVLGRLFQKTAEIYRRAANSHGWLLIGHLDRDHTADAGVTKGYGNFLCALKSLDIPGVDAIGGQILSDGSRMDGHALAFFPRFASSAAVQKNSTLALSESFAVYGNALSGDEMRYILNYQLARGIDLFNFMLTPDTVQGRYAFSERPYFHPDIPGFFALDSLNAEIGRECAFMAAGLHAAGTALYYPHAQIAAGGPEGLRAIEAFRAAGDLLEAEGTDFDLIDDETIMPSPIENMTLLCGGAVYTRVVIPAGISLSSEMRRKLSMLRGEAKEFVKTDEPCFLHRTVRCKDGELHICVFNQSSEEKNARVFVKTERPILRADPKTGELLPFQNGDLVSLSYGQCALLTTAKDNAVLAETKQCREALPLIPVSAAAVSEFCLSGSGAALEPSGKELPPPDPGGAEFPSEFCGEIAYSFSFEADRAHDLTLDITELRYFAEVFVNGVRVGSICTSPYRSSIKKRYLLQGTNELIVKVADLAGSAYARYPAERFFDRKDLGPYHERTLRFEKQVRPGGFAGLRLYQTEYADS
ncbi:MAG: hypothetical protein IK118_11085 [Clostridia bacterium]|nr:hypothetical protein [Clostridia bacterium]